MVVPVHTKDLFAARTALLCRQRAGDAEKYTQRMGMLYSFAISIQWDLVSGSAFVLSNRALCSSSRGRIDQMVSCLSLILVLIVAVALLLRFRDGRQTAGILQGIEKLMQGVYIPTTTDLPAVRCSLATLIHLGRWPGLISIPFS